MKPLSLISSIFIIIPLACAYLTAPAVVNTPTLGFPTIIDHPKPSLVAPPSDVFEEAGCPIVEGVTYNICESDSPLHAIGCRALIQPDDLIGGLEPSYPIMLCEIDFSAGGSAHLATEHLELLQLEYVIFRNGEFELVTSESQWGDIYAPIESENEALSYAMVITRYDAYYEESDYFSYYHFHDVQPANLRYYADVLEDTHVVEVEDGYEVNLFDVALWGGVVCLYPTSEIVVKVGTNGSIGIGPKRTLFELPNSEPCAVP